MIYGDVIEAGGDKGAVLFKGVSETYIIMSREKSTRRQKDISRLLRERNRLRKSAPKKVKKK